MEKSNWTTKYLSASSPPYWKRQYKREFSVGYQKKLRKGDTWRDSEGIRNEAHIAATSTLLEFASKGVHKKAQTPLMKKMYGWGESTTKADLK